MRKRLKRYFAAISFLYLYTTVQIDSSVVINAEHLAAPGMTGYIEGKMQRRQNLTSCLSSMLFPLNAYMEKKVRDTITEDDKTCRMILSMQKEEQVTKSEEEVKQNTMNVHAEQLYSYDYLIQNYYTVDSITYADEKLINAKDMLAKNMKLQKKKEDYQVLIFHTHAQEAFADSKKNDANTSIVGMGAYLSELLNKKGIKTIHHAGVYDLVDGKLDRSKAYELSEAGVRKILKEHPNIEVVIDLHRDGVSEDTRLVTKVNGKQTAKIMFFNGLSRTRQNGEISYLYNPYRKDNLAFSFQMQLACEKKYPGFARHIYLKGYRYSLHMRPKSLLIEAGAQNNTVKEMRNAMELLSDVLVDVLK